MDTEDTFDELQRLAGGLAPGALDGARQLLIRGYKISLPNAEMAQLTAVIREVTGLLASVVRAAALDAGHHHPIYGYLADVGAVAAALRKDIETKFGPCMHTDGRLWAYIGDKGHPDFGIWFPCSDRDLEDYFVANFSHPLVQTRGQRQEVFRRLEAICREEDAFGVAGPGLCLNSGFLAYDRDVCNTRLMEHAPANGARFKVSVDYDEAAEAPEFERGLLRVFGADQRKCEAFLQFLACAVFQGLPEGDAVRRCLILVGPARSGKSTLIRLAKRFFKDDEVSSLPPEHWSRAEDLIQLLRCPLNVVTELNRRPARGDSVKKVLSGEPVIVRHMRENSFSAVIRTHHIFACNELPRVDEKDSSVLRRFMVLHLPRSLTEAEAAEDFWQVVDREAPGIVNLLASQFVQAQRQRRFTLPEDNEALVSRMQFGDDLVGLFVRAHLEASPGARTSSPDLMAALRTQAAELDMDPAEAVHAGTMRRLSQEMAARYGATHGKSNGIPYYVGVRLRGGPGVTVQQLDAAGQAELGDLNGYEGL